MARPRREIVDGRAWCEYHSRWEPVEDFRWTTHQSGHTGVTRLPRPNCKLAEQTIRDHGRESDPAKTAIEGRAKKHARLIRAGYKWVLIELNWQALIPIMRALLGADGLCLNCGRHRPSATELHIEHRVPPEGPDDWPAQHARNLWIACEGCNLEKGPSESDRTWLEREQRKWEIDRDWASHAGEKGWPAKLMISIRPAQVQLSLDAVVPEAWPEGSLFTGWTP